VRVGAVVPRLQRYGERECVRPMIGSPSRTLALAGLAMACLLSACTPAGGTAKTYPVLKSQTTLALTAADSGRTMTIAQGDIFRIDLAKEAGWDQFSTPVSSDGTVSAPLHARPQSTPGLTSMAFAALWPGTVRLVASTNKECARVAPASGQVSACLVVQRGFEVTVDVVSGRRPTFELAAGEWSRQADYRLIPGDRVVVSTLSGGAPESDNPKVLSLAGQDSSQRFFTFATLATGKARLGWVNDPCHSQACMSPVSLFRINIDVVVPSS
jgi:hypothetical protein